TSALFAAFKRVDPIPILLHVYDRPAPRLGFSQSLVQAAERRPLIGIFADGIGVMNEQSKARSRAYGGPLQHRQIAVGVTKCSDGSASDVHVDTHRLALVVVDKVHFRQAR